MFVGLHVHWIGTFLVALRFSQPALQSELRNGGKFMSEHTCMAQFPFCRAQYIQFVSLKGRNFLLKCFFGAMFIGLGPLCCVPFLSASPSKWTETHLPNHECIHTCSSVPLSSIYHIFYLSSIYHIYHLSHLSYFPPGPTNNQVTSHWWVPKHCSKLVSSKSKFPFCETDGFHPSCTLTLRGIFSSL